MHTTDTAHKSNVLHGNTSMTWTMPGPTYPAVNSIWVCIMFHKLSSQCIITSPPLLLLLLLLLEKGTDNDRIDDNDDNVNDK